MSYMKNTDDDAVSFGLAPTASTPSTAEPVSPTPSRGPVTEVLSSDAKKPQADKALRALIDAWDALPGGQNHSPWAVEEWLKKYMAPAVRNGRQALKEVQA